MDKTQLFNTFLFPERTVEVVMSLERQNSLISAVHDGLTISLTSKAQSTHFGRDKASYTPTHMPTSHNAYVEGKC